MRWRGEEEMGVLDGKGMDFERHRYQEMCYRRMRLGSALGKGRNGVYVVV